MKKLFLGLLAGAAMLFTACQDEEVKAVVDGDTTVAITAQLPTGVSTRAYADGKTATKLTYAIYETGQTTPLITGNATFVELKTTVNVRLVNGKTYDMLFWAQADGAPYTFNTATQKVTVDYTAPVGQDEKRDAFFKAERLTVDGTIDKTIQLKRPFAQLNVGAQDFVAAKTAGFEATQTTVKVDNVYTTLNLLDGTVEGETSVTYKAAALPTEDFPVSLTPAAKYMSMDYLLVADDKALTNVTFTATNGTHNVERLYTNVPVRRNYRTNIYGNILTEEANFNIEIDSDFDEPDYVYDLDVVAKVASNEELSNAISDGKSVILLGEGTYTLPASARGKTLTFVGTGDASNTVIKAVKNGEGDYSLDGSTAVFENLSITFGDSNGIYNGFVRCNGTFKNCIINNQLTLYGNSTFEGCTFNVEGDAYNVWTWGAKKAIFNNCTFNSDGKSMLLYGGSTTILTINNCTFNDNGTTAYGKTAIEIGNDYNATYELIVNNTNVNGFEQNSHGIPTGTTLWSNKNSMDKDHLSVTVDGTKVY